MQPPERMKHLVIGLGQVGKPLQEIFKCKGIDSQDMFNGESFDIIHIAFPYSDKFISQVKEYQKIFSPKFTVIHSTVPIGTSAKVGALHSPIRGKHPNLKESILTFVKYISGPGCDTLAEEFQKFGLKTESILYTEDTEAGKLFDLMQYGAMILLEKEIYKYCEEHSYLNFNTVYRAFNQTYNQGYKEMGMPQVIRPVLSHVPGKIAGHCVVQMMSLLDSPTALKIILENKRLESET